MTCAGSIPALSATFGGTMGLKKYQVVFVDEYNNWWLVGFFDNLRDAEPQLNDYLKCYNACEGDEEYDHFAFGDNETLGPLTEYMATSGWCFDRIIDVDAGVIEVRGFIFE